MGYIPDAFASFNRSTLLPVRYSVAPRRMEPALADLLTKLRASTPTADCQCAARSTSGSSSDGREAVQSTTRRMAPMGTEPDSDDPAL